MKKFREIKVEHFFQKRKIVYPLIYGKIANMIDIQIEFLGTKWLHMHEILLKT